MCPHRRHDVGVTDTPGRLLKLLSLLQRQPRWRGPELAERLGVTTRTVRRDVDRLRTLGYPVDAEPGVDGGYRLAIGAALPPLLLDDDEATAIAVALGVSTGGAVRGMEQPALAALAKLDRVLPARLRQRVDALRTSVVTMAPPSDDVDADLLVTLAQACEGRERVALS
jgi:predicted DNA-binding transcriptional regulator YafY